MFEENEEICVRLFLVIKEKILPKFTMHQFNALKILEKTVNLIMDLRSVNWPIKDYCNYQYYYVQRVL